MRYYSVEIEDGPTFTSYKNGANIRGALLVEFDLPISAYAVPTGSVFVRIWGVPLKQINQSSDFNRKNIKVFGGMKPGLPLATAVANSGQAGLLVQGFIFQAFGNWINTDMSLDLIIVSGEAPPSDKPIDYPKNLTLKWKKGQLLSEALTSMFGVAFTTFKTDINISSKLIALEDKTVVFEGGLYEVGRYVNDISRSIINQEKYSGVNIAPSGGKFIISDGTATGQKEKAIKFQDLIGQPTWIGPAQMQFKTTIRADIGVGDIVVMPAAQVTNTAAAQTSLVNLKSAFEGKFQVSSVHHVGNSRQPDASAWTTTFDTFPQTVTAAG